MTPHTPHTTDRCWGGTNLGAMGSPLLTSSGAVEATARPRRRRALRRSIRRTACADHAVGLVDRSNRGVVRITGADRLSWLHSLTTQDIEQLAPARRGAGARAEPERPRRAPSHPGRRRHGGVGTCRNLARRRRLISFLDSMRFMLRVEPEDVTGQFAVRDAEAARRG